MKLAYYPGCSLCGTAREYNISTIKVSEKLGIELEEIPDWSCCGATSAHTSSPLLGVALPARNLAIAEEMGLDVAAPCAACYHNLSAARVKMDRDHLLRKRIEEIIDRKYRGKVKVLPLAEVILSRVGLDAVRDSLVHPLAGLKMAAYYGCLMVRPKGIVDFDDPENPTKLDQIMEAAGGEMVDWSHKTECCGASLSLTGTELCVDLVGRILERAAEEGAECIVTACPFCQANLDMRQAEAATKLKTDFRLPVLYFTQLLGIALGLPAGELGLDSHVVDPRPLLREKGLI
ncbi:MAG: CoB--CoM heterodisulfide reductase iron-sulfur subunit B family protein [Firmicutes bacterium]|nr:CoB--CoM heterodisulfide reductase iron-sulfur subunit B family protein [Bacillota bacterium]